MKKTKFVYVIYIRTTPKKLWQALTQPKFIKQYFCGTTQECAWKRGGSWKIMIPDGRVADSGKVLEIKPEKRLVLSWRNEFIPAMRKEGYSRMTYELERSGDAVKLIVTHEMNKPKSKFIGSVSEGWPAILSSLKSLLETGDSLNETKNWPEGA
jgi:uncharacterized protein YndB with AHSA1/START domain